MIVNLRNYLLLMYIIYANIGFIFWVSFAMIIWFHSDIVDTFGKIIKFFKIGFLQKWLKINEYNEYKLEVDLMSTYPDFLYSNYPNPLTKLISCNICLPFWLTVIHTFAVWNWQYALFIFPINYCISLCIYLFARKLL